MDLLSELNSLALTAHSSDSLGPIEEASVRWQELFNYRSEEAESLIASQRADLTSSTITQDLWEMIQYSPEARGHDRESYTHFLDMSRRSKAPSSVPTHSSTLGEEWLFRLSRPFDTAVEVQRVAGLDKPPATRTGVSTEGDGSKSAQFCIVSSEARFELTAWAAENHFPSPDFIRISVAPKNFSSISMAPSLGRLTTLPQNRMSDKAAEPRPRQNEYPVWYFFYGTLQDSEKLRALFAGEEDERYGSRVASVKGGRLVEWGGKYKGLVDDFPGLYEKGSVIRGKALLVETKEQEDALRVYETAAYEVVRCGIVLKGGEEVVGCTFRVREV